MICQEQIKVPIIKTRNRSVKAKKRKLSEEEQVETSPESFIGSLVRIPVCSESFETIINNQKIYVDKTDIINELINHSPAIFIARPRKFGKSLVLDIIFHILSGNKELFKGLKIFSLRSDWKEHAVFRLNFAKYHHDILVCLKSAIEDVAFKYSIPLQGMTTIADTLRVFETLCNSLRSQRNLPTAVLIDEYDIPIVEYCENATANNTMIERNAKDLASIFNHFKQAPISFFMATGVAKFAKTHLFSAANHLQDLSLHKLTSTLYGYTKQDVEINFRDHLKTLASLKHTSVEKLMKEIINYYNGYCFTFESTETILNPYDINKLLFYQSEQFKPFWIEEGRPRYFGDRPWAECVDLAKWKNTPIDDSSFNKFDPLAMFTNNFYPAAFLAQVGLLTIRKTKNGFVLDIPNQEVRLAFLESLLDDNQPTKPLQHAELCKQYIAEGNFEKFVNQLKSFFASLPYSLTFRIAKFEAYYHTCIYLLVSLMGYNVTAEDSVSTGRIDLVIEEESFVWVIEFKLDKTAQCGMDQIQEKEYHNKYENLKKKVSLGSINFSSSSRNISDYDSCIIYGNDESDVIEQIGGDVVISSPKKLIIVQVNENLESQPLLCDYLKGNKPANISFENWELLIKYLEKEEYSFESFKMLTEKELEDIGLKKGPTKLILKFISTFNSNKK